jgi:hypothetical protein
MSTASLLRWIALVAGAELAVRGHLANHAWTCHAGAALFAIALAALAWPTRARRAGAIVAAAVLALAAIDAAIGAFAAPPRPPPASLRERAEPVTPESALPVSAAPAPGSTVILVFAGRDRDGQSPLSGSLLRAFLRERLDCEAPIEVVEAGTRGPLGDPPALGASLAQFHPALVLVLAANELLDDVIAESAALDFPAPEPIGPRGSPLGRALEGALAEWRRERAWRRTLGAEVALDPRASRVVARYRELVLAARRADAEVALLIPALAVAPDAPRDRIRAAELDAPHARRWLLASRAHARSLRTLAGSYGIPAIDTRPGLEGASSGAFAELGQLDTAGRERLAQTVADALAERLARTAPGCRTAEQRAPE